MKAALLDIGGVVVDVDPRACFASWAQSANVDAERIAERWLVDDAYKAFEVGAIEFGEYARHLAARLGITLSEEDWRTGWNALLREPITEVTRFLPSVATTVPLYGFSNTNAEHQAVWQVRLADSLRAFTKVYVSWRIGCRKPDVQAFRQVVDDIGVAAGDILFLDDNLENVAGAIAAGLDARHVTGPAATLTVLREVAGGVAP